MRKYILTIPLCLLLFLSCRKDKEVVQVKAIVKTKVDATGTSWYVEIQNKDYTKQSFLCDPTTAMTSSYYPNCGNTAAITNLPAALAVPEQKIIFTKWKDLGTGTPPIPRAPHYLEVSDVKPDL